VVFLVGACGAGTNGSPGTNTSTSTDTSTVTGTSTGTSTSTTSTSTVAGSTSGGVPGFDGWLTLDPGSVNLGTTPTGFALTLTKRAEWSGSSRGVLFYTTMDGNFRLTATVRARRTSDSSKDPGGDGTIQLAGLMARRDSSAESWVLLEVGGAATGLVVATDSTLDGVGHLVPSAWNDNEADLKLCRIGTTFSFWKRTADSDGDWLAAGRVERNDLRGTLEVGATLSANATPDLTAFFDGLTLEPLDPGEAC
jgi:hypothetical protein